MFISPAHTVQQCRIGVRKKSPVRLAKCGGRQGCMVVDVQRAAHGWYCTVARTHARTRAHAHTHAHTHARTHTHTHGLLYKVARWFCLPILGHPPVGVRVGGVIDGGDTGEEDPSRLRSMLCLALGSHSAPAAAWAGSCTAGSPSAAAVSILSQGRRSRGLSRSKGARAPVVQASVPVHSGQ